MHGDVSHGEYYGALRRFRNARPGTSAQCTVHPCGVATRSDRKVIRRYAGCVTRVVAGVVSFSPWLPRANGTPPDDAHNLRSD